MVFMFIKALASAFVFVFEVFNVSYDVGNNFFFFRSLCYRCKFEEYMLFACELGSFLAIG